MKILVITEIRLYRDGVAEALRGLEDVETVSTAATGAAAALTARRGETDVALLDMALPGSTQTVASLLTARSDLKVVALGLPEDGPEVVASAEAGICGYISREATLAEVGDALRCAARGEAPISARAAAGLLRHIAVNARAQRAVHSSADIGAVLTPRERQVVHLIQSGMTNRQIARTLDLQLSTVKNHVHNVLSKCGIERRAEVIATARLQFA